MKTKTIYCIGPSINNERLSFSGQAMMFQLLVDKLKLNHSNVNIIDIAEKETNRISGSFTFSRLIQYFLLFINFFIHLFI